MEQTHAPKPAATDAGTWDDYIRSYYEKPTSFKSWSGYDLKEIYTPEDRPEENYETNVADAGTYPFTRGIHANMFRGRLWTKREVVGIGSPADTHARLKYLSQHGGSGLNTIADVTLLTRGSRWTSMVASREMIMSITSRETIVAQVSSSSRNPAFLKPTRKPRPSSRSLTME